MLKKLFCNLQQELKAFIYWCLVFTILRVLFICLYSSQLPDGFDAEFGKCVRLGFRLSLKTAGLICLFSFVFTSIFSFLVKEKPRKYSVNATEEGELYSPSERKQKDSVYLSKTDKFRLGFHGLTLFIFSALFYARWTYYHVFNATFNHMIINGIYDDKAAIWETIVDRYHFWDKMGGAAIMAAVFAYGFFCWIYKTGVINLDEYTKRGKILLGILVLLGVPTLWVYCRYGGAFSYGDSVNWESAGRLTSNLLNEAVLDDGQALYRVWSNKKRLDAVHRIDLSKDEIQKHIQVLGGKSDSGNIDGAFLRQTKGAKIKTAPNNVIVILGESIGSWPLYAPYDKMNLLPNYKKMANDVHGASIESMIPQGDGTITSINGVLTGLYGDSLYENHQPITFKEKYESGLGYIFKKLGYRTIFWYGGYGTWQNIKNFVLAQSFDDFYCADEFGDSQSGSWGCDDDILLKKVNNFIAANNKEKVLHVILTTNNHPPYPFPVDKLGFRRNKVRENLPEEITYSEQNLTELGHIWYTDKVVGEFLRTAQALDETALFVLSGDHSERFSFAKEVPTRTTSAIPCIFYGQGVEKNLFSASSYGCHAQLPGTLAEMLAPAGFTYSAILPNMFENQDPVFATNLYAYKDTVGRTKDEAFKNLPQDVKNRMDAARKLSTQRVFQGNKIK